MIGVLRKEMPHVRSGGLGGFRQVENGGTSGDQNSTRKSKEGEKCRPSEEHLETSPAAVGGAGDQLKERLKNSQSLKYLLDGKCLRVY